MKKIEVKILNPESIDQAEKLMVCAARLTQRGHQISCLDDFMDLYEKPYQRSTVANLVKLPHPTIQKFGIINMVVVGASRRFLAQITRHQNEVKYMSASLQYSDYSGVEDFVIPYDLMGTGQEKEYLKQCSSSMKNYEELIKAGVDNDSAGYIFPRSGLSAKGIVCELPPIDSGYTGEVRAIISNVGREKYEIKAGDKIGQLVIMPVLIPDFTFEEWKERGTGAFGSTGR